MRNKNPALLPGIILLLSASVAKAQFSEQFSDGELTSSPAWVGNVADWTINSSLQLQSNHSIANSSFYISTASTLATTAAWEFFCQIGFNPSSANYIDVYLTADASDLTAPATSGYFVRIGNSNDEISLYRKDAAGSQTMLIDGINGILNSSNNSMKIRVTRDAANTWTLFRDLTGTGYSFVTEGSVTDATYSNSSFFGILVKQSTASFFQKHFFDDIIVQPFIPDLIPPTLQSVTTISSNTLDILFNEPVTQSSSEITSHYFVNNGIGYPASASRDPANSALVHLMFTYTFSNGSNYSINISQVEDIAGNTISNGTGSFSYYIPQRYDVVIDELMADPSPQVGLPNYEWLELKNTSAFPVNLQGWRIRDVNNSSGPMPSVILAPGSYVIICSNTALPAMSVFGNSIGITGFPSLDNEGEAISLVDAMGKTIAAISYSLAWYENELKKDGGWSLEMMDPKKPCMGAGNWKASTDPSGGTPGKINTVDGINTDQQSPSLKRAHAINPTTIIAVFDEPIDSVSGATIQYFSISNGLTILSATPIAPLFNEIQLSLNMPMQPGIIYDLQVNGITDCQGNQAGTNNQVRVGLATDASTGDIIVNEILFNPRSNAYDFVEIYNNSIKIIDAAQLYIANRNSTNTISNIKQVSALNRLVFPGDYFVVTEDAASLALHYLVQQPDQVLTVPALPGYPDDEGNVILLNQQGNVLDEVKYNKDWHFKLLDDVEGISLERIDPSGPSQEPANWHSAASTAGFATPTYKNSQYKSAGSIAATIEVVPKIFSPDNDGRDDITSVQYAVASPGYVANTTIFDGAGRPVRSLVRNGTLGLSGSWNWDGLDDKGMRLPTGTYIILTEIFNLEGKKQQFKNAVVLARKLH